MGVLTLISFAADIGVDLGTSKLAVCSQDRGLDFVGPSVVAWKPSTGAVVAVGAEAVEAAADQPGSIELKRPVRDAHIHDLDMAVFLLTKAIHEARGGGARFSRRVFAAIPCYLTPLQRRATVQAFLLAGARGVELVPGVVLSAIGAGLDPHGPGGLLMVDIGAGCCDIALVSMGEVIHSETLLVGGDSMNGNIVRSVKRAHGIQLSDAMAERTKAEAFTPAVESVTVRGIRVADGLPCEVSIPAVEVRVAARAVIPRVIEASLRVLEKAGPELSGDIVNRGIVLTGGVAPVPGLSQAMRERLGLPVSLIDQPSMSCARGFGCFLERSERRLPDSLGRVMVGLGSRLSGRRSS